MAEEKASSSDESPPPKLGKSNTVLIVIIAVLATILVGGGVLTFFLMKKSGDHSDDSASQATPADAGAKADGKKKDKNKNDGPKSPAIYVALEPPFVVNFDATQAARFLQVNVEVMTRDSNMAQLIKDNNPVVRNDLLLLFGGQDANVIGTREGKEGLRKQALEAVRTVVKNEGGKPELVEAIYFTSFVMQ